jgi:hypothetical protein
MTGKSPKKSAECRIYIIIFSLNIVFNKFFNTLKGKNYE